MVLRRSLEKIKFFNRKLDVMIKNDIRLFLRDKRALILALLTPFFIMAILINVYNFSDITENIRGIKLGICEREPLDIEINTTIFQITKFQDSCEGLVRKKVMTGELRAAIIIPENFRKDIEEGKGAEIEAFIDNSKSTTSIVSIDAMKAFVSDMNEEIGREFILNAWKNLNKLNENLKVLVRNLAYAKSASEELKMTLDETSIELEGYELGKYNIILDEIYNYLEAVEMLDMAGYLRNVTALDEKYSITGYNITGYNITGYNITGTVYNITGYNTTGYNITGTGYNITGHNITAYNITWYNITEYNITDERTLALVEELNSRITELEKKNDELNLAIDDAAKRMNAIAEITPLGLKENITYLKAELKSIQDKISAIDSNITALRISLDDHLAQIVQLTDELNQTITIIEDYTRRNPESILRPVTLDADSVFKGKTVIYYRLPVLAATVLMFVTLLIASSTIVAERKAGTMARIFLSPISMFFYIFEKIGYLFVLSVIQLISIYITIRLFSIPLQLSIDLAAMLIVSSVLFITLGITIGTFSRSENTALLISLVMGLPMMFMTDLFSPPELMTEITKTVTQYLPLSLSVEGIENIVIYGSAISPELIVKMMGIAFLLYLLSTFFIYRKPTL